MKKLSVGFAILLYCYIAILPKIASAQESLPSPACQCTPGEVLRCYDTIPDGWCGKDPKAIIGRGKMVNIACDCGESDVPGSEGCYDACPPPKPIITPAFYSLDPSVGRFNEGMEGPVHSGTRQTDCQTRVDPSNINNYGPVVVLQPKDINHALRAKFVKEQGDYEVCLANGSKKKVWDVWFECTEPGANPDNWQIYQDKLENCSSWGLVPTTDRQLASEPTPAVKTREGYFQEEKSPFVMSWLTPWEWVSRFFQLLQDIICRTVGWFCKESSLPLRNPDDAPGWTGGKPNIPKEAESNAKLLRQILLPQDFPLGELPSKSEKERTSYFDLWATDKKTVKLFQQVEKATRYTSADAGLFRIFQPKEITPTPAVCDETNFNDPDKCASAYYFYLMNASPGFICGQGKICYGDTPDQQTYAAKRIQQQPSDDRPLGLRTGLEFLHQTLWPQVLGQPGPNYPGPKIPPGSGKLDFLIPYRDAGIRVVSPEAIKALVKSSWPAARLDLWDLVIEKSVALGINPAFTLAIWIEESGASDPVVDAWSAFGCFPGGDTSQRVSFETSLNCFLNFTANEHPNSFEEWARYFCGPKIEPICANNPGFLDRFKYWYSRLVPPGNPGAIIPKP